MKPIHRITIFLSALALTIPVAHAATVSVESQPGYVDLGTFVPSESGGQFVEVNLHGTLLRLASRIAGKDDPEVGKLLQGLHAVRINVVSLDESNRADLEQRADSIRDSLVSKGWQKVVTVRESKDHVSIYMKSGADDTIEGITLTVLGKDGEAVFLNVVGNIQPEQLALVADEFGIDPLKEVVDEAKSSKS